MPCKIQRKPYFCLKSPNSLSKAALSANKCSPSVMDRPLLAPIRIASASLNFFAIGFQSIIFVRSFLFYGCCDGSLLPEGSQSFRQISLQIQAASPQMLWPMSCLSIKTCIKDVFVFGSKFPEGQFDDTGCHLTHAKFQQQDFFVGLIHYPASQESMVAVQVILPEGSLQKGIISYQGTSTRPQSGNEEQLPPAGAHPPNDRSVPLPVRGFPKYHPDSWLHWQ